MPNQMTNSMWFDWKCTSNTECSWYTTKMVGYMLRAYGKEGPDADHLSTVRAHLEYTRKRDITNREPIRVTLRTTVSLGRAIQLNRTKMMHDD